MFKVIQKHQKVIAAFFMAVFITTLVPMRAWALTSGPDAPEAKGFQPAGINNLVDLFSGDFHYNLPLLDVGGYPLNLSYGSGQGMDDEASWVGYGWSLNPGAVNRQMRGLPDDFKGTGLTGDVIEKQTAMKPMVTKSIGATFALKLRSRKLLPLKFNLAFTHSNYTGIKADLGVNTGLQVTQNSASSSTVNFGIQTDNQGGGSFNASVNFPVAHKKIHKREFDMKGELGFNYNATKGLEGLTLSTSFGEIKGDQRKALPLDLSGSEFISFAGNSYIPSVEVPQRTKDFTFTLRLGGQIFPVSTSLGFKGTFSKQDVDPNFKTKYYPAYGSLNSFAAKNDRGAMMDFNRENEHPYHKKMPYLPIPVTTQDLFTANSQGGSGQYKVNISSSGIMAENTQQSKSTKLGLGVELTFGNTFKLGIPDLSYNQTTSRSGKWLDRNDFRTNGDFINTSASNAALQEAYFKKVGEPSFNDQSFTQNIGSSEAVAVSLRDDFWAKTFGRGTALNKLKSKRGLTYANALQKNSQDSRNENFGYLTASEAQLYGLEKSIPSYPIGNIVIKGCNDYLVNNLPRQSGALGKKAHHISEIVITQPNGSRQVYGVPVYNIKQDEVSFSVKHDPVARQKGLIQYAPLEDSLPVEGDARLSSKDYQYNFSKQRMRGYATSYLLSGILSPDYVDVTDNGISDDDLGNAVKFNYSKLGDIKWRTPFYDSSANKDRIANYSEGFLSDKKDDKASYVYGEKEQWYLHSVESKTMLALFVLEDRDDALGVNNSDGSINTSLKMKRLKEIRLYSKADLYSNRNNLSLAVPIKTVHFEYNYELFSNVPNSAAGGKLTLKRVYFTFGKNGSGRLHPYKFNYNVPAYQKYQFRQYDRWGMYKPVDSTNPNGLNNAEYPYSTQDRTKADRWAGYWQLSEIQLPSGGSINITYESDDYAYVQDKRASTMCFIKGIGAVGQADNIKDQRDFFIDLPQPVADVNEMKQKYFEGMENLYFKCFVDMDNKNTNYEFIPGYAKIESLQWVNSTTAKVRVKKVDNYNPISKSAWQILRNSLPKLAYPEYDNLDSDESDFVKGIRAMVSAISRIADIVRSFDSRAARKGFGNRINLNKSWVRLCAPDHKKIGGGSRVKKIMMYDKWSEMTGNANTESASYGQSYSYTTERSLSTGEHITISSGVASYEPQIGGDENPFKQPVNITQNRFLGVDEHYYVEMPLGESYYPAPAVGYSRVIMKNIGADNSEGATGSTTTEFYTCKDFPTRVEATNLQRVQPVLRKIFRLFSVKMTDHATVSQGYLVQNYNMHGKEKAEKIVDKNGQEISAVFYEYKTDNKNSPKATLNNIVPVIKKDGTIGQAELGVDYDFFTDMKEAQTENIGINAEPGVGLFFTPWPRPWFYFGGISPNYDKRLFRSAVAIKNINSFPVLQKVIKVEKGSRMETENVLWDAETGDVLMTKTQNEFDDAIYSFNYPAHWSYDGMGPAYKNQGLYFSSFYSDANGLISNGSYSSLLVPGDELVQVINQYNSEVKKFWIIKGTDNALRTVDENGIVTSIGYKTVKVLRSGRRNLSSTPVGTIVSLKNPVVGNRLRVDNVTQVLNANAAIFAEEWAMPVKMRCGSACPPGYNQTPGGICYSGSGINPSNCGANTTNLNLCARPYVEYISNGGRFYNTGYASDGSGTFSSFNNSFWTNASPALTTKGPLNRSGVWTCSFNYTTAWVGKSVKKYFPESKTYYVGIAADNYVRFKIDGQLKVQFGNPGPVGFLSGNFRYWHVYPVTLSAGYHLIEVAGKNDGAESDFACEIYNNTPSQIMSALGTGDLNYILATSEWVNQPTNVFDNGSCRTCAVGYAFNPDDGKCYLVAPSDPNANVFNPYRNNILGNWKPVKNFVFDINRTTLVADNAILGSTNIRKAGYYAGFSPYWASNGSNFTPYTSGSMFSRWAWTNESTLFNTKGLAVENKDALGQYSAAQAGYLQSVPVAVASNARLRDIAYDGFEDYSLALQCSTDTCSLYPGHFNFQKVVNNNTIKVDTTYAHSGRYSLKLNATALMSRSIYQMNDVLYTRDAKGQYNIASNYMMKGFSPIPGKKYVLSMWVKDLNPTSVNPGVNITVGGATFWYFNMKAPVIEGWKRVEIVFDHTDVNNFNLTIEPVGGTVYIDDIRIHPYDAHLRSFVYDANSLRLVADMDENNFASFYEYDDEGILVRTKRETEKGIMTLHETRSGVRKSN
jgi:hypothetical protein